MFFSSFNVTNLSNASIPDFRAGGTLYDAGEMSILSSNKDSIPHFIHKTRGYCKKRIKMYYMLYKHKEKVYYGDVV